MPENVDSESGKAGLALVTGGSGALGREIAIALAHAGLDVAVHYRSNREAAEQVSDAVRALGRRAVVVTADVRDAGQVARMVEAVTAHSRAPTVLVNGAGISRDGVVWRLKADDWSDVLRTNLDGVFNCTRAVLPAMREAGQGRVVSLSSTVGQIGVAGTSAYAASKAALLGFTRAVARDVAPKNITVNAIALGYFSVGIINTIAPEQQEVIRRQIPLGRFGDPRHVGQLIAFLCSDAGSYITGQTINLNGGIHM